MNRIHPSRLFLAETSVQLVGTLTLLRDIGDGDSCVLIEAGMSHDEKIFEDLVSYGRSNFPKTRFILVSIESKFRYSEYTTLKDRACKLAIIAGKIEDYLDALWLDEFQCTWRTFRSTVRDLYFTFPHLYVLAMMDQCRGARFHAFPHALDSPRADQLLEYSYFYRKRAPINGLLELPKQLKRSQLLNLITCTIFRILRIRSIHLPLTGVDATHTFRKSVPHSKAAIHHVTDLRITLDSVLASPPWGDSIREWPPGKCLLLLLPEYNRNPIWSENTNFGAAHLKLVCEVINRHQFDQVIIKPHVRSSPLIADQMREFLIKQGVAIPISSIPREFQALPVEALSLIPGVHAACSIGSCSFPPGIGLDLPHYVSKEAAVMLKAGWKSLFYLNHVSYSEMLISQGFCTEI